MNRAPARLWLSMLTCAVLASAAALAGAAARAAAASPAIVVSSNWAGYAATSPSGGEGRFSRAAGSWTQPAVSCRPNAASYSAIWVGLGGFSSGSKALEQIGTEADCTRSGTARYSTWLELVPEAPVTLKLKVRPGDHMAASVTVAGNQAKLHITDLSSGSRVQTTRRISAPDTSSAEWVVEAPSICSGPRACATLALSDFGTATFSSALATAGGHTGTIGDPHWTTTELELRQGAGGARGPRAGQRFIGVRTPIAAAPSSPPGPDGVFSVSWGELPEPEQPNQAVVPTGPGE